MMGRVDSVKAINNKLSSKQNILSKSSVRRNITGWLMMSLGIICFLVFVIQPILVGLYMSFFKTKGFDTVEFIGLKNYVDVMTDSLFLKSAVNSFKYTFWSVAIGGFTPLIVAIMLNEVVRGKGFFRFAVYFPCIIPGIVTAIMWKVLFQPDANGFLNMIFEKINLGPFKWLQDAKMTIPLITATMTWGAFGSTTIVYLANLQSVDHSLYEAAEIDGSSFWGKLRYVTLPHVSGLLRMMLILQIMGVFKVFQQPLAMTGGGPANASISLMMAAYNYAFSYMEVGKSTAVGMVTALILCVLSIIYFKLTGKKEDA